MCQFQVLMTSHNHNDLNRIILPTLPSVAILKQSYTPFSQNAVAARSSALSTRRYTVLVPQNTTDFALLAAWTRHEHGASGGGTTEYCVVSADMCGMAAVVSAAEHRVATAFCATPSRVSNEMGDSSRPYRLTI